MRRLLLSFIASTLLLTTAISAKESDYTVTIEHDESAKKGVFLNKIIIKLKDAVVSVWTSVATNITANEITDYIKKYGDDTTKMAKYFNGKLNISLIKNFKAKKDYYQRVEPIHVSYSIRQKAYTYLISIEDGETCLVYPNQRHRANISYKNYNLNGFGFDKRGIVEMYVVGSLDKIDFSDFSPKKIYQCTTSKRGLAKISNMQKNNLHDVKRFDIIIK